MRKYFTKLQSKINPRTLCIIVFGLNFTWLLTLPFQGPLFYYPMENGEPFIDISVFFLIFAHVIGLISGFFFRFKMHHTYWLNILFSLSATIVTVLLLVTPLDMLKYALLAVSILAGIMLASWANYLKAYAPIGSRTTFVADLFIASYSGLIFITMISYFVSLYIALITCTSFLLLGFLCSFFLPKHSPEKITVSPTSNKNTPPFYRVLFTLCIFIFLISMTSGLLQHVLIPISKGFEWLTAYYYNIPYLFAIIIMRNLFKKGHKALFLYIGISMLGFAFIGIMLLNHSLTSYLIIITLALSTYGIYDLFWWGTLGEMLEFDQNPSKFLGLGLAINVLGVLAGGMMGNALSSHPQLNQYATAISLISICVVFVVLPILHQHLALLLARHSDFTSFLNLPQNEKDEKILKYATSISLSKREIEIMVALSTGKTYKTMALEFHISENTVKTHVKNIYVKTQVRTKGELMHLINAL